MGWVWEEYSHLNNNNEQQHHCCLLFGCHVTLNDVAPGHVDVVSTHFVGDMVLPCCSCSGGYAHEWMEAGSSHW